MQDIADSLQHLITAPYLYMIGALVLLLAFLYVMVWYRRSRRGIIPFKSEGGSVEISPHTLRSVMQIAASNVQGVEKMECRHILRGNKLGAKVSIELRANYPLREVEAEIKARIRTGLNDQFGIERVEPIHIRVTKIIGELSPPAAGTKSREKFADRSSPDRSNEDPFDVMADPESVTDSKK